VLTACAVKALGGAMLARLSPQTVEERREVEEAGLDIRHIYTCSDLVKSEDIYFAATGITSSELLSGIHIEGNYAHLHSLLIRAETGTQRFIHAEQHLKHFQDAL
jgi:fructose-1,6-bisphosphatase II